MFRFIACFLVPLFLPWGLWYLKKGRRLKRVPHEKLWPAGLVLAMLSLSFWAAYDRFPANSVYVPARFENGELRPARFESPLNEN